MSLSGVEIRREPELGDVHGVGAVHDQRLHHRDQHVLHQGGQQPVLDNVNISAGSDTHHAVSYQGYRQQIEHFIMLSNKLFAQKVAIFVCLLFTRVTPSELKILCLVNSNRYQQNCLEFTSQKTFIYFTYYKITKLN